MGVPSKIALLPDDVRVALDKQLIGSAFGGHEALSGWLEAQGYEISRSVIQRHSQRLKQRLEAIKASTQAAQILAESVPDDAGSLSSALLAMVQTAMFDLLVNLQEVEAAEDVNTRIKLLSNVGHVLAALARASTTQKQFALDVKKRIQHEIEVEAQREDGTYVVGVLERVQNEMLKAYGLPV